MNRLVLDTNIVVSGFIFGGIPRQIINLCRNVFCKSLVSFPMLNELARVLRYKKFNLALDQAISLVIDYGQISELVEVDKVHFQVIREDETDNIILDCAVAGNADFIITGDKHLLNLGEFQGIKIVKPITFVKDFLS